MNGHGCIAGGRAARLVSDQLSVFSRQMENRKRTPGVRLGTWRLNMANEDKQNNYKRFVLFVVGFFILVLGITLILVCFKDVVVLFRGALGIVFALAGLFMLYAVSKK